MTQEEIMYKMACDFDYGDYSELGKVDYKFYENIEGEDIAKYFAKKLAERDEETQKQIEAVRGLKRAYKTLMGVLAHKKGVPVDCMSESLALEMHIATLTQTLKPYLNGEELEV